jgi:hypothetical protein
MSQYLKKGGVSQAPAFDPNVVFEVLSPAQITATQNDYNPGVGSFWRLSTDASRTITGILAGSSGQLLTIVNVGANPLILANQNAGSADANKIITGTGADVTLTADQSINLVYDAVTVRWRVSSSPSAGGAAGAGETVFNYLTFA